jgi:hypothetical protein
LNVIADAINLYGLPRGDLTVTTLMICEIPARQNIYKITEAIDLHGFANTYDLAHLRLRRQALVF